VETVFTSQGESPLLAVVLVFIMTDLVSVMTDLVLILADILLVRLFAAVFLADLLLILVDRAFVSMDLLAFGCSAGSVAAPHVLMLDRLVLLDLLLVRADRILILIDHMVIMANVALLLVGVLLVLLDLAGIIVNLALVLRERGRSKSQSPEHGRNHQFFHCSGPFMSWLIIKSSL
jgi:hypothetical protein